jgi:hypothetical protein
MLVELKASGQARSLAAITIQATQVVEEALIAEQHHLANVIAIDTS